MCIGPVTARALAQQTGAPFLTAEDISRRGRGRMHSARTPAQESAGGVKRPAAQAAGPGGLRIHMGCIIPGLRDRDLKKTGISRYGFISTAEILFSDAVRKILRKRYLPLVRKNLGVPSRGWNG